MSHPNSYRLLCAAAFLVCTGAQAGSFNSGSTGALGAFSPTENTTVDLPANGILHYTTISIPSGVTVKFKRNAANTAVIMLATGDVTIAGTIDISGGASQTTKYGLVADMNKGGIGGPGGFDGGRGGMQEQNRKGGAGFGPGAGGGGNGSNGVYAASQTCSDHMEGGGGGGFSGAGEMSFCARNWGYHATYRSGYAGATYGANSMLPLVGGSGGGGGSGGLSAGGLPGGGGGGGGGALMIVATGAVQLNGTINATGGRAGNINNNNCESSLKNSGGAGGGGAGGAVRILAPAFSGSGAISVGGAFGGCRADGTGLDYMTAGGHGAIGRSSVEIVSGGTFNIGVIPILTISSIAGVTVPANPSGAGDINLPADQANPAAVVVSASCIPLGTLVKLTLNQPYADKVTTDTSALTGTLAASTASGNINIPAGNSVLTASTTYSLTLAMGEALKVYAQGERVEKVTLAAVLGGETQVTLITVSGKEYQVPAAVFAAVPA